MENIRNRVDASPKGFWKGLDAVKKLVKEAGVPEDVARLWLMKQAIWQIHLPTPKHIPRPSFHVESSNTVHRADLIFLPHDRLPRGRRVYKYASTVVDVASRFKAAEPLTSKDSSEVSKAFQKNYKRLLLRWRKVPQVDPGREFMGETTKETAKHDVRIRRGNVNVHRDQGIVGRFNRTLSERLFTFQSGQEINFEDKKRSTEWVKRLPEVVSALNSEETRLTGKKLIDAIKEKAVDAKSSTSYSRPVGFKEKRLDSSKNVRYLYAAVLFKEPLVNGSEHIRLVSCSLYNSWQNLGRSGEISSLDAQDNSSVKKISERNYSLKSLGKALGDGLKNEGVKVRQKFIII
ncbi:hypothetical protein AWC38_SpisGene12054 [Stylophora pistillata]|uniref:Integrase catalytic domain-containing protein n=1 Tax=Stylophora pistillata TaxID=50429 RepID=A0A2B4S3M6_STYPI|nr:hypothetical protein AWC38_SpisGene12054 [Stylophora pistillata]